MGLAKRGLLIVLVTVLFSSMALAGNFSAQSGYDWLSEQQSTDGSFNSDVTTTAWAIMALDAAGYDTSTATSWLYEQISTDYCFPSSSCTIQDTAMAILAFKEQQDDTYFDEFDTYLTDALSAGSDSAWKIEIVSSEEGTCTASYVIGESEYEVTINVADSSLTTDTCSTGSNFLEINSCLVTNILTNNPGITFDIDCDLTSSPVITLVYLQDSTYYLLENENSKNAELKVNNGCFGKSSGSSCNLDASMYAAWALEEMDSTTNTHIYLKQNYDSSDVEDLAFMYLITLDSTYLDALVELQKSDGSFERSNTLTALAILALDDSTTYSTEIESAKSWLREEQSDDYNWGSSVTDTAIVLYSAFTDEEVTPATCDDAIQNQGEEGVDCGGPCDACAEGEVGECSTNSDCETLYGSGYYCSANYCYPETSDGICNTDDDCDYGYRCLYDQCIESQCEINGQCEYPDWNENAYNCPEDCYCGDGICDDYETSTSCSEDCGGSTTTDTNTDTTTYEPKEEEGGSGILVIIIILILLLALGGGGYYAYSQGYLDEILNKFNKPKGPTPITGTQYKPFTSQQPSFGTQQRPPQ